MEPSATIPAASSGRLLKSESGKGRSLSEDRIKFVEEEYDYLSVEIAAWLSQLIGKEVGSNLAESLKSGVVLCDIVAHCLPSVKIGKYHPQADEGSFYEKDNLTIFARCCQEMGIDPNDCVSVSMFERGNKKQIVNALLRFAVVGAKRGLKPITLKDKDRLQSFVEAMPEDVVKGLRDIVEETAEEPKKEESKEPEKQWDRQDDINMCILITLMFAVLAGMFYIAALLQKQPALHVC